MGAAGQRRALIFAGRGAEADLASGPSIAVVPTPTRQTAVGEDGWRDRYPFEQARAIAGGCYGWLGEIGKWITKPLAPQPGQPLLPPKQEPLESVQFVGLAIAGIAQAGLHHKTRGGVGAEVAAGIELAVFRGEGAGVDLHSNAVLRLPESFRRERTEPVVRIGSFALEVVSELSGSPPAVELTVLVRRGGGHGQARRNKGSRLLRGRRPGGGGVPQELQAAQRTRRLVWCGSQFAFPGHVEWHRQEYVLSLFRLSPRERPHGSEGAVGFARDVNVRVMRF